MYRSTICTSTITIAITKRGPLTGVMMILAATKNGAGDLRRAELIGSVQRRRASDYETKAYRTPFTKLIQ